MIEILWNIFVSFLICTLIYGVLVIFIIIHKVNMLEKEYFARLEASFNKAINDINNIGSCAMTLNDINTCDDDSTYDKTDEELLEDWNNLWGGNPPCELNIKAIRDEEKRERENKNNKE